MTRLFHMRPDTKSFDQKFASATSLSLAIALCILGAAGLLIVPAAQAQNPPPVIAPSGPPPPPGYTPPGQAPSHDNRIKAATDLVVLHVTVADERGQFVEDLNEGNFRVFEQNVEQKISIFSREDIPVTMGLVIDNSGSMREKREQVSTAAMTFVKTSNPQDEAFVVNFNDEYYLDTDGDFTSDQKNLNDALSRIDTRGSTALYDAVIGSLGHLKKGHKDKRVLLLITDGDDDASQKSLEDAMKAAEQSNATIYTIGIFSEDDRQHEKGMIRHSKKILKELADATGGQAYFPDNLSDVTPICQQVAREIRNQYTVGYYPTNNAKDGTFRPVQLKVIPPNGRGKLSVRTRTGYFAPSANASGPQTSTPSGQ
jgi:Ca-activated chloride channel homolog